MLFDFEIEKIPSSFDVCIVGAGPAGITLALKLANLGISVGLLEAGDLEYSERSQSLYQVESTGAELWASSTRLRYFGGTSNHWAGRCRPFERDDFETPPLGGLSGWPISFNEIDKYLSEAMQILDLPSEGFTPVNAPLPGGRFDADVFSLSPPTRFARKYLADLKISHRVTLVVNCNVVGIEFDKSTSQVKGLSIANYRQQKGAVNAKYFVLAAGAIENSRLLLNCREMISEGIGGSMIGRGFMEHLNVELGTFIFSQKSTSQTLQFFANKKLAKEQKIGKGNISLSVLQEVQSGGRAATIKSFLKTVSCKMGVEEKIQFLGKFNCPGTGVIGTLLEQFPVANGSRIMLGDSRDSLGLRRAKVNWVLSDYDRNSIRKMAMQLAKDFAEAGLGFIRLNDFIVDPSRKIEFGPHAHHMGGTRMGASVNDGVVDVNSRVFLTKNLYVAGSSVFATGGGGNPTMPILQLTLRLADHLHGVLLYRQSNAKV